MSPKTVLITGCTAGGIGSSLAIAFHESGYLVFATARAQAKIDKMLSGLPRVRMLTLDVTDLAQISRAAAEVSTATHGRLDVLVNNAGTNYTMPVLDTPIESAKQIFDVNFWAPMQVIQAFAPLLTEAKGTVVNISSIAAVLQTPWMGIYGASKAAMASLSETLRLELTPLGVRVITVMAGNVETRFWESRTEFALPPGSMYGPIASTIADAASGRLGGKQLPANVFSRGILNAVEAGRYGLVWEGALAGTARWVLKFIPIGLLDKLLSFGRGLAELDQLRKEDEKRK